jgi:hypothetical protein
LGKEVREERQEEEEEQGDDVASMKETGQRICRLIAFQIFERQKQSVSGMKDGILEEEWWIGNKAREGGD